MKTKQRIAAIMLATVTGLSLASCGGGGGGSSDKSPSGDSAPSEESPATPPTNNNTQKPTQPAYTGWAPKDLKGYTIKFNKKVQTLDTFTFTDPYSGVSSIGNICLLTYTWINNNTARIDKLYVSRRFYGTDNLWELSGFKIENATLNFTSANGGTISGAANIKIDGGNYLVGGGWTSFTIHK